MYNDIEVVQDADAFRKLTENGKLNFLYSIFSLFPSGIDRVLAQHIAHLFVRDTLTLFEEQLHLDNTKDTDHFEVRQISFLRNQTIVILLQRISIPLIGNRCVSNHHP